MSSITGTAEAQRTAATLKALEQDMFPVLTLHDRCAFCDQQASAQIFVAGDTFKLCGHHYRKHSPAALEQGYPVSPPADYPEPFLVSTPVAEMYKGQVRDAGSTPL